MLFSLCLLEDDPSQALSYYNEGEKHLNVVKQVRPEIAEKNINRLQMHRDSKKYMC